MEMARHLCAFAVTAALLATISGTGPALAQKAGGVLKIYHRDSPASMSILEEATNSTEIPMMGVFNNLVLYKQDVPQNSLQSIIPDLATDWSWNEDGTELTFRLRKGVKWHDGHPFTANDVKSQAPQAICELGPANAHANLIINRDAPPFDNPQMRRALALALDRKAFIDILTEGQGDVGG